MSIGCAVQGFLLIDEGDQLDKIDLGEHVTIDETQVRLRLYRADQRHEEVCRNVRPEVLSRNDRIGFDRALHKGTEATQTVEEEQICILGFGGVEEGVVEQQLSHMLYQGSVYLEMRTVSDTFVKTDRHILHKSKEFSHQQGIFSQQEQHLPDFTEQGFFFEECFSVLNNQPRRYSLLQRWIIWI